MSFISERFEIAISLYQAKILYIISSLAIFHSIGNKQ